MGLFDFAANIGKKLFNKKEDASAAVMTHLTEDNPGIENLHVTVDANGVATLSGTAANAAALEKAVLMTGNIEGIAEVNVEGVNVANGEPLAGEDEFYVIKKGDTLWAIATKAYGNGTKYKAIVEANKEVIKDENKIFPGQKIRIPKGL